MGMDAKEMKEMLGDRLVDIVAPSLSQWNPKSKKGCCLYHQEKTPSFGYDSEHLQFHCFGCGASMDIYDFVEEFELNIKGQADSFKQSAAWLANYLGVDYGRKKVNDLSNQGGKGKWRNPEKSPEFNLKSKTGREYAMPGLESESASVELVDYLDTRGITEKTIAHFGLTGNSRRMFFNIRDEKGVLRNCKGRNIGDFEDSKEKGYTQTKNAKQSLFGMHIIKFNLPLYITEGEIDAMSLFECGVENVVSIPAGCSNTGWIDQNWEWLKKFEQGFVVYGDMDAAGQKFRREVCGRLGVERSRFIEYDHKENKKIKDANGILKTFGVDRLLIVVKTFMHEHPIDGGVMVLDVPDYDPSDLSKNIPTGVYGIDRALIDPRMGQVVLLAGSEGTGKSTLIGQFMLNAIAYGFKSMIFSGEMGAEMIKQWVYNQAAQNVAYMTKIDIKYDRVDYAPRPQLKKMIDKHVGNNLIIFDDNILLGENPPRILDVFEEHAKRKGVKVFVIDNMMTSDYERYGPRGNTNIQETNFMRAATSMAKRIGVLIYVIDHPRKVTAGGSRKIENDEISGSGGKKNLAQITIILDRNDEEPDVTYAHIKKNRFGSIKTDVPMLFDISKREYRCKEKGVTTVYPWVLEYEVWLQNEREQSKKNKRLEVK